MSGVILHRTIAALHKLLDPSRDLREYIPKHDSISFTTSFHGPLFLLTIALSINYGREQIIQFCCGAEADASLIFIT